MPFLPAGEGLMNLSTELLIGIVLIGLGLLLGAAAYMVLSSRGESEVDSEEPDEQDEHEPEDEKDLEEEDQEDTEIGEDDQAAEVDELEPDPSVMSSTDEEAAAPTDDESSEPEVESMVEIETSSIPTTDPVDTEADAAEPEPGPRIQVATLLRDEVTGALIIKVGDREYQSATELKDSQDWTRVEYAASDLSKWIEEPEPRSSPDREAEPGERGGPKSMIEQINEILQEKIETSGKSHLAVRLIEGPEGSARVLIGVHSYELGEVPDESVNELIRAAVAEWEAAS